jgi:hypothetical protein
VRPARGGCRRGVRRRAPPRRSRRGRVAAGAARRRPTDRRETGRATAHASGEGTTCGRRADVGGRSCIGGAVCGKVGTPTRGGTDAWRRRCAAGPARGRPRAGGRTTRAVPTVALLARVRQARGRDRSGAGRSRSRPRAAAPAGGAPDRGRPSRHRSSRHRPTRRTDRDRSRRAVVRPPSLPAAGTGVRPSARPCGRAGHALFAFRTRAVPGRPRAVDARRPSRLPAPPHTHQHSPSHAAPSVPLPVRRPSAGPPHVGRAARARRCPRRGARPRRDVT